MNTSTSGLAYRHVAFLAAASWGFSPVPSPEIVQDRNRESMLEEMLNLLCKQRILPNVVNSMTNRPCAPGGSVSTWPDNSPAGQ